MSLEDIREKIDKLYDEKPADAVDLASQYNNMSLVLQEEEKWAEAIALQEKAMEIISLYPDKRYELAMTHANLGNSLIGIIKYIVNAMALENDEALQIAGLKGINLSDFDGYTQRASEHLLTAVDIFHERGEHGVHIATALTGLGELSALQGDALKSIEYFGEALDCIENNIGKTDAYYRAKDGYKLALDSLLAKTDVINEKNEGNMQDDLPLNVKERLMSGQDICKAYYDQIIAPMLEREFPELAGHVCAGLFGEGSDAYGYDDYTSRDHDWGPGVILLIDDGWNFDQTSQKYTDKLNQKLLTLASENADFMGVSIDVSSIKSGRRGAFTVSEYFGRLVGENFIGGLLNIINNPVSAGVDIKGAIAAASVTAATVATEVDIAAVIAGAIREAIPEQDLSMNMMTLNQVELSAAVNGVIWCDPSGQTSIIRNILGGFYPNMLRRALLANEITLFSQNGQYNYRRMKQRDEALAAELLLDKCIENSIKIEYLLHKQYAPHDKWLIAGLRKFSTPEFENLIIDVKNAARRVPMVRVTDTALKGVNDAILALADYLQAEMLEQGLINEKKSYMADLVSQILV